MKNPGNCYSPLDYDETYDAICTVQLPFDAAAFSVANSAVRSRLLKDFIGVGKIKDPAVLVDCKGIAVVWYLPDAIPFGIQVRLTCSVIDHAPANAIHSSRHSTRRILFHPG